MTILVASIVLYNNDKHMIRNVVNSYFANDIGNILYIVDNSPTDILKTEISGSNIHYHFSGGNLGYGKGHNWAIANAEESKYHMILNPDVIIKNGVIEELVHFMDLNHDVGMVCPKILNEDGSVQYLNKRITTVYDLLLRKFLPDAFRSFFQKRLDYYEMKDIGYDKSYDVPLMSGAFMLCRTSVLKSVGGFDPRYFMYFEDYDLSRKIQKYNYRTVYYPHVSIIHSWGRASHKSARMLMIFIINGIRYFNKWGWKLY
jgi:GT2 family glycosyltransferase